jgi:hypothetical protein
LRSESTDTKFNSSRCDEKFRGRVRPFLSETRLKDVVNADERSNLLIFSGEIYMRKNQRFQIIVCQSKDSQLFGKKCAVLEMIDGSHLKSHLNVEVKAYSRGES